MYDRNPLCIRDCEIIIIFPLTSMASSYSLTLQFIAQANQGCSASGNIEAWDRVAIREIMD